MTDDLADLPQPGDVLAGKYRIERLLGAGGMGVVMSAYHLRLDRKVAVKLLLPSCRKDAAVTARFEREARAAVRLTSPHVARVLDVDTLDDKSPFLVMELLEGVGLDEELARRVRLPVAEAVGITLDVCTAMAEAHRLGVVHRDLKPSNLFLADEDGKRVVKVLDFGISKVKDDVSGSMTSTASAFGTPLYMSPEMVRSAKHVDERTDIWSLGVVLYEMLSGQSPFDGPSATAILAAIAADKPKELVAVQPDVPPALAAVVMKTLEKAPEKRHADVRQLAAELERARDGLASPSTMTALTSIPPPASTTRRRGAAFGAVGLIVVVGIAAFVATRALMSRPPAPAADGETAPRSRPVEAAQQHPAAVIAAPATAMAAPVASASAEAPPASSSADADAPSSAPSATSAVGVAAAPPRAQNKPGAPRPPATTAPPHPKSAPPDAKPPPKDDPSHL